MQQPTDNWPISPDEIMKVNPANSLGYGLVLLVLIIFCIVFYRRYVEAVAYSRQVVEAQIKSHEELIKIFVKMEVFLQDLKSLQPSIADAIAKIQPGIAEQIHKLQKEHEEILRAVRSNGQ